MLRDVYVRGKYRDVILPMTVFRRLDAVLESTKQAVLDMKATPRSIIEYVTREIVSTSMLQDNAERQIALLREYRTRLIADVVTGKLDVREAAARLPETDPLAGDRDRADAIDTESNLHSAESHVAKEAIP